MSVYFSLLLQPPISTLFPYTTLFRSRLTGGPANSSCLQNTEQMGEGWSDFFGALLTIQPGDVAADPRAVGTYLFGQGPGGRSEEHTSELQSRPHLVCRLLLEKKKNK